VKGKNRKRMQVKGIRIRRDGNRGIKEEDGGREK
jgi:hypothetical protein